MGCTWGGEAVAGSLPLLFPFATGAEASPSSDMDAGEALKLSHSGVVSPADGLKGTASGLSLDGDRGGVACADVEAIQDAAAWARGGRRGGESSSSRPWSPSSMRQPQLGSKRVFGGRRDRVVTGEGTGKGCRRLEGGTCLREGGTFVLERRPRVATEKPSAHKTLTLMAMMIIS